MREDVIRFCFDTTAINTGKHNGTSTLLEQLLDTNLIHLACRHHIMELILGAVFSASSPSTSTGPNVKLFKSFQNQWSSVSKSDFERVWSCVVIQSVLHNDRDDLLQCAYNQLSKKQHCDAYKEYLELAIIFLGSPVPNFSFKRPGAMHYAHWMAKILYCLKIWMFQKQINNLDQNDIELLKL